MKSPLIRRSSSRITPYLSIAILLSLVSCQSGGGPSSGPALSTVPELTKPAQTAVDAAIKADIPLTDAEHVAGNLPASPDRVALINDLGSVRRWYSTNLASLVSILGSSKLADKAIADRDSQIKNISKGLEAANKEIASLKAKDPVKTTLTLIGIGAIVLGGFLLIGSFFVSFLQGLPGLRLGAAGVIVFGLYTITIAYYLTEIRWIVLSTIIGSVVLGIVWLWAHRSLLTKAAKLEASFSDVKAG